MVGFVRLFGPLFGFIKARGDIFPDFNQYIDKPTEIDGLNTKKNTQTCSITKQIVFWSSGTVLIISKQRDSNKRPEELTKNNAAPFPRKLHVFEFLHVKMFVNFAGCPVSTTLIMSDVAVQGPLVI